MYKETQESGICWDPGNVESSIGNTMIVVTLRIAQADLDGATSLLTQMLTDKRFLEHPDFIHHFNAHMRRLEENTEKRRQAGASDENNSFLQRQNLTWQVINNLEINLDED